METKNMFKALAMVMLMPAMLLTTACSNDDFAVNDNTEIVNQKGFTIPVTINVTRQGDDATMRATYTDNGNGTGTLGFSSGDKLLVKGTHEAAENFAGVLTWVSGGTFSGTILTDNPYGGTAEALLSGAQDASAMLLPVGYDTYGYLSIKEEGTTAAYIDKDDTKLFALTKAAAVEQFSEEYADAYSSGFALMPYNAILNFTISGLSASAAVDVALTGSGYNITGSVTTNGSGVASFAIGVAGGTDFNDLTLTVGGNDITLASGSKTLAAGKIYNITRAVTPPTLAQTRTNAGMTVKVKYYYENGENYCLFSSNGDGSYTFQSGDGWAGGDEDCAKDLVDEGGKLVFKQNVYETIDDTWSKYGFSVTFDTSNNTYSNWVGPLAQEFHNPSFISVEVNSVPIALTQKITVSDLVKAEGQFWSEIINNNSDKIQLDGDNVERVSDGAKLQYDMFGSGDWQYVRTTDGYQTMWTYKFEGD